MQNQKKSVILKSKLQRYYEKEGINEKQRQEINRLRVEYTAKQRELLEKYMQFEISVIEDLGGKYQPKIAIPKNV